eukprot:6479871-Prymnesium_polylepis.1
MSKCEVTKPSSTKKAFARAACAAAFRYNCRASSNVLTTDTSSHSRLGGGKLSASNASEGSGPSDVPSLAASRRSSSSSEANRPWEAARSRPSQRST